MILEKTIKDLLPSLRYHASKAYHRIKGDHRQSSFGQDGEDLILLRYFDHKTTGFYVDVGAHHPVRFSNTYLFYKRGWNGINIDAMPNSMDIFDVLRKRDINLEIPVSDKEETLPFYVFNEPALNGFSKELSEERDHTRHYKILYVKELKTKPLKDILDQHLPFGQTIDFMTVDVEGHDLQVLRSNDWDKYRPKVVLAETLDLNMQDLSQDEVYSFMNSIGYELFAKTLCTAFFKDCRDK